MNHDGVPIAGRLSEVFTATRSSPTDQFRAIKPPTGTCRIGFFFVAASQVPSDLWDWRDVNPREVTDRSAVFKAIATTLTQEPSRFHERNRGITVVADSITFDDKRKKVVLTLTDATLHGVVDGGHTLHAVLETQKAPPADGWPAQVFVKVLVDVDPDQIAEIAGGLNTSQQVDLKSLENLREHFDELKRAIAGEPYADLIAYKMNEDKPIDVREILYYLAVFDCEQFSEKKHPVALFGRKEGIVRQFAEQAARGNRESFAKLISGARDILRLRDMLERRALAFNVGRFKTAKNARIRSSSNRGNKLYFLDESVDGKIPLGWLMPMLAGFRANVDWTRSKGKFGWIVPLEELLDRSIEQLLGGICELHEQENSRPEYVGRNALAWRISYSAVAQAIMGWQLDKRANGSAAHGRR